MAYSEELAECVRGVLKRRKGISEKKMFGGLSFLLNGNMACGVIGEELVLRLGNEGSAEALEEAHTRAMDFTGRPMKSMVYVEPAGFRADADLKAWVDRGARFARSLPPK